MISEEYKKRAHKLIEDAQNKGLIINYTDFCQTQLGKETELSEEEVEYYVSKHKNTKKYRKCDDFIKIENRQIAFKIGSVTEDDLISFLNIYEKYLINKNKKN